MYILGSGPFHYSMRTPRGLALFAVLLDLHLHQANAIPAECDPNYVLIEDEIKCMELLKINRSSHNVGQEECRGLWDDVSCWPHAVEGEVVSVPCPTFLQTTGRVYKNCTESGWSESYPPHEIACDYGFNGSFSIETAVSPRYFLYVRIMYSVGYAASLVSLVVAVTILCLFRRLHCTRNLVHIQLFLSFILRSTLIFVRDLLLFTSQDHFHCGVYPMSCKIATALSNYSIMANYSWLLAEGHYLYSLVSVSLFSRRRHLGWYIALGWGAPAVVLVAWCGSRCYFEDEGCWETRRVEWIWWILRAPVLLFIIVNLSFFLCIMRILVAKLRTQDMPGNEFNHYRKLAKSSFLLVSLFGLHYILFAFVPDKVNNTSVEIWNFIELAFASTQGFVVAILYCFLNGEVKSEMRRRWGRWRLMQGLQGQRQRGSMSQSGGATTNVSLLQRGPTTPPPSLEK
ncbi:secretin receptor [Gadus chalcogrammus]|uniref:secretin receptor n=1 Tax=Gadus chalcogrammus TaxID=1042646 RepID=UPI0024C4E485|nr:secretin receptor [Gadus chalcogrammus]